MIRIRESFSDLQLAIMPFFELKITLASLTMYVYGLIQKIPEKLMSHLENYQQMMQVRYHNNTFLNIIAQDWQNLYKNYCDAILLFGIFQGLVL